jgi:hypothetical protein
MLSGLQLHQELQFLITADTQTCESTVILLQSLRSHFTKITPLYNIRPSSFIKSKLQ